MGIKGEYALAPSSFIGVRPKVVVREGDNVKVGDPLFVNKDFEDVVFTSPVSGTVKEIVRGDRRKVLYVKVLASEAQEYKEFEVKGHSNFSDDELLTLLYYPITLWRVNKCISKAKIYFCFCIQRYASFCRLRI